MKRALVMGKDGTFWRDSSLPWKTQGRSSFEICCLLAGSSWATGLQILPLESLLWRVNRHPSPQIPHDRVYETCFSWLLSGPVRSSRMRVSSSQAPGSQVPPLCSQSVLKDRVSLGAGTQSLLRGASCPPLGRSCGGTRRSTTNGLGSALGVLVRTTGLLGQLKLPTSNSFYIPKRWGNICDPVVTGFPLPGSH